MQKRLALRVRALSVLMGSVGSLLAAGAVQALEFRTLSDNAIVYDAGSRQARPLFILLRTTPVEPIVSLESWVKIREAGGGIGWVERSQLTTPPADRKSLIVTAASVELRAQPGDTSPAVLQVGKDVLLEQIEAPAGTWVKVKHRDGQVGYVPLRTVWGH